jgi:hypothetical protein
VQTLALRLFQAPLTRIKLALIWYPDCPYHYQKPANWHSGRSFKFNAIFPGQDQFMKTIIVALSFLCFLCATAAFGQTAAVLPNNPQPLQMQDHPQHASDHAMAREDSLFSPDSPYSYAQGEVPLADLGSPIYHTPLGDIARANRKDHSTAAKAVKVFDNN